MIDFDYSEKLKSLPVEAKRLWRAILRGTFSFEKNDLTVTEDRHVKVVSEELLEMLVGVGFIKDLTVNKSRYMFTIVQWSWLLANNDIAILDIASDGGLTAEKYEALYVAGNDVATMDAAIEKLEELDLIVRNENDDFVLTF